MGVSSKVDMLVGVIRAGVGAGLALMIFCQAKALFWH
jgi:hypothetical protein